MAEMPEFILRLRRPPAAVVAGLALAVLPCLAYGRVLANDFEFVAYDDPVYVTDNPNVHTGLSWANVEWALTSFEHDNWHPLTWISLQADATLYGSDARGFHLTNLLLHAANVVLLFTALRALTGATWRSAAAAALFAVHPLHVESVAWVSERKDVLSTFFWMLTLLAYARYAAHPGALRYAAVLACFAVGLAAKQMLVTLPVVLCLLDYWPLKRWPQLGQKTALVRLGDRPCPVPSLNTWVAERLLPFFLALVAGLLTLVAQRPRGIGEFSPAARVANAAVAYVTYLGKMIWPANLCNFYPHRGDATSLTAAVLACAFLAGCTVLAFLLRRRRPYILVGWLWYVITLLPVVGLVQVGDQALADRYVYVPLVGIYVIVAWGAADLLAAAKVPAWLWGTVAGVVLVLLAATTWRQAGYWRNSIALWRHCVEVTRHSAAYWGLATSYARAGRLEEAREQMQTAVEMAPDNAQYHKTFADLLRKMGRTEEAEKHFREALRLYGR
jgi:tetratricopeptide (TPR) repeat protein